MDALTAISKITQTATAWIVGHKNALKQDIYTDTFMSLYDSKFQIHVIFDFSKIGQLIPQQTANQSHFQKSKIGLVEHSRLHLWTDS